MDKGTDIYWRLRPAAPTPSDELCSCDGRPPVLLVHRLTDNPIACFDCNLEVPLEQVGFNEGVAEQVAHWNGLAGALEQLWLDSDEYEAWAVERLTDPDGRVNVLAQAVVEALNRDVRAYHWWFVDIDTQVDECPRCDGPLDLRPSTVPQSRKVCERCSISITDYTQPQ